MINLIKNEIYKIFHKKGIYVVLIITALFSLLTNYIYSSGLMDYNYVDEEYETELFYLEMLEEDGDTSSEEYLASKTVVSVYEYAKSFGENSWQRVVLTNDISYNEEIFDIYYRIVSYEAKVSDDLDDYLIAKNEAEALKSKFNNMTEKEFLEEKLNESEEMLLSALEIGDEETIATYQAEVMALKLRYDYHISYAFDRKNERLENYQYYQQVVLMYEKKDILKDEEQEIYDNAKEEVAIAKAIIEKEVDEPPFDSNYTIISNFYNEYFIMILVIIVLISGSIVSEEFSKGTIKLLLVKPYSRTKIILSKYITTLIMILFAIVATFIFQLIIGGIFFGYDSLSVPFFIYNHTSEVVEIINIFKYFGLTTIAILPQLILIATLAFTLSTLFTSTALANTLTIVAVFGSDLVNMIAQSFEIEILKYFITLNWDLTPFLFGGTSPYKGITLPFSIIICLIYWLIMILLSVVVFKKRNIKNI